jgi:hypothetical protein
MLASGVRSASTSCLVTHVTLPIAEIEALSSSSAEVRGARQIVSPIYASACYSSACIFIHMVYWYIMVYLKELSKKKCHTLYNIVYIYSHIVTLRK